MVILKYLRWWKIDKTTSLWIRKLFQKIHHITYHMANVNDVFNVDRDFIKFSQFWSVIKGNTKTFQCINEMIRSKNDNHSTVFFSLNSALFIGGELKSIRSIASVSEVRSKRIISTRQATCVYKFLGSLNLIDFKAHWTHDKLSISWIV